MPKLKMPRFKFGFPQATDKGEGLSKAFEDYAAPFGFADWPQFHKTWTVVRTRFIDDCIRDLV